MGLAHILPSNPGVSAAAAEKHYTRWQGCVGRKPSVWVVNDPNITGSPGELESPQELPMFYYALIFSLLAWGRRPRLGWGHHHGLASWLDSFHSWSASTGGPTVSRTHAACRLIDLYDGLQARQDGGLRSMKTSQIWYSRATLRAFAVIVGVSLLAMVMTACGTLTGAAVGAGSGAAVGAAAGDAKKGALIGAGVGATGGAIYDATR
jgi:YMGG-like Gly-zipper